MQGTPNASDSFLLTSTIPRALGHQKILIFGGKTLLPEKIPG
jgi:hypothetical protein